MVWDKRKGLKEHLSFNAFLYTVTYNAIRKYFRKKAREKKYLDRFLVDYDGKYNKTVTDIEYNNLLELANEAIEKLSEKRKLIFQLSRHKGLTNMEIAKRLNISKKTVENQINSALKFLKKQFEKEILFTLLFYYLFIF